jgi:SAM-dependent methyltransferase
MSKDLLDMSKYESRGAYHIKKFLNDPVSHAQTIRILNEIFTLQPPSDYSIVDIGCGEGLYVHELSRLGYSIFGIDANELAIKLGHEHGIQNIACQTVYELDKHYFTALLFDSFEHFEHQELAAKRISDYVEHSIFVLNPRWDCDFHADVLSPDDFCRLFPGFKIIKQFSLEVKDGKTKDFLYLVRK